MELCREPMVRRYDIYLVALQYRLLGITMQLHSLLGMKARDMALHCICIMIFGCEVYALEYGFGRYW